MQLNDIIEIYTYMIGVRNTGDSAYYVNTAVTLLHVQLHTKIKRI